MLPLDQKFHIYSQLSNFDIIDFVLCKVDVDLLQKSSELQYAINDCLELVLTESKVWYYLSNYRLYLTDMIVLCPEYDSIAVPY